MSLGRLGDARLAKEDLAGARAAYQESLDIGRKLAAQDKGNAEAQRDVVVGLTKFGGVKLEAGDQAGALAAYQESLDIARKLAGQDPGDADVQRDVLVSLENVGDVEVKQGNLQDALASYRDSLAIMQRLASFDHNNAQWRADLQDVIDRIGDVAYALILAHDFKRALESADQAISLAPEEIWLYTNRAHALMFIGRVDEARMIYLKYRDQYDVQQGKSWKTVILEDFVELRKAGLTSPLMTEIEKRFKSEG